MSDFERFIEKVEKRDDGCWGWSASFAGRGYPVFWWDGKQSYGHRFAYIYYRGEIPDDKVIDHVCENIGCVNPDHLEAVTHRKNLMRHGREGIPREERHNYCVRGHEFTDENTHVNPRGSKVCRRCERERMRRVRG